MKLNNPSKEEIEFLESFYGKDFIQSVKVVKGNEILLIFRSPADYQNLTQKHIEVLFELELGGELENPSFLDVEDGILCID